MRIAYVCLDPGVPVYGRKGSSVHCQEVIRALIKRGWQVEVFASRLERDVPFDLIDVPCHHLPVARSNTNQLRELSLIALNSQLSDAMEQVAEFDLVYERYSLWSHAGMEFANNRCIPGILEVNSPLIEEQKLYRSLHSEQLARQISQRCMNLATSIVAVSEQIGRHLERDPTIKTNVNIVPNGVNVNSFESKQKMERELAADTVNVGFVGTLKPWHGVSNLIHSFVQLHREFPKTRLTIVGDGPQRSQLTDQVKQAFPEIVHSIHWVGAVPSWRVHQYLSSFDIAVAPYPDLENFYFSPLKILEYMAAGLPVVASRIGQIPELICDQINGVLVEPGCIKQLADALALLHQDQALRERLGTSARKTVEESHTWDSVVDRILNTIDFHPAPAGQEI